jgi:branched-chain amino acid transport system ATP-binding protein
MDLIMELCDPVVVMAEGKVLAQGHMADLRQNEKVREAYLGSRSSTQETACEREDSGS